MSDAGERFDSSVEAPSPLAIYQARIEAFGQNVDRLQSRSDRLGNARLIAFVASAGIAILGVRADQTWLYALAAVLLIAFGVLISMHRRSGRELRRATLLRTINEEAVLRLRRDFDRLPLREDINTEAGHPYARDLDIFGHGSLHHLIDVTQTRLGETRLVHWLSQAPEAESVPGRQERVRSMAPLLDWRQNLQVSGRMVDGREASVDAFLGWAESQPIVLPRRLVRWLGVLLPLGLIVSTALSSLGPIPSALSLGFLMANLLLWYGNKAAVEQRIELIAGQVQAVNQYALVLEQIDAYPANDALRDEINQRAGSGDDSAWRWVGRLNRLTRFVIPPSAMLHFLLQVTLNWDLNLLGQLERWQQRVGSRVANWLSLIADVEAHASLAGLAHDQPEWVYPEVDPPADVFTAKGLGHPLLTDDARVVNDVTIGPPGHFLFVTGSNMAGKSTLLRAIGVNLVLGAAGAPVCATSLRMPPVELWTSVRVEDSLNRGVSFYMAELLRLKEIVNAADAWRPGAPRVLFLLDEILQGTNTAERQIAARRVIRHLLDREAIGAVSTHDLGLADGPELAEAAAPVHLRDTVTGDGISFDYVLRPGIATSTNALRLMELVFGKAEP